MGYTWKHIDLLFSFFEIVSRFIFSYLGTVSVYFFDISVSYFHFSVTERFDFEIFGIVSKIDF